MRIRDLGIFLTLDPVSGMEKFGPGINITDPQHCSGSMRKIFENFS
jgi:hypothetical protein